MPDETVKLTPCPFCGAEVLRVLQMAGPNSGYWYADCTECNASMQADSEEELIAAWNRRAALARRDAALLQIADEIEDDYWAARIREIIEKETK
jgi:Lar family restriction alleviation protein